MTRTKLRIKPGRGEKRAWEDRLLLRAPRFFRALFSIVLRLPPWLPPRGLILRRAIGQAIGSLNRRDLEPLLARYDDSIEVHLEEGPQALPDMGGTYRGAEQAREVMEDFLDAWEEVRWTPSELVDGGRCFVLLLDVAGRGRAGLELSEELGVIYTLRRGRVVRQSLHWGWDKTLRLADLAG